MEYSDKEKVEGLTFTGTGLAYSNSESGYPYTKEIWESMVEVLKPDLTKGLVDPLYPVASRSEVFENAIKKTGITQVLEIASGWSTHGLKLCKNNPNFKYVEVLLKNEETNTDEADEKRRVYKHMRKSKRIDSLPKNLHTIGGSALDEKTFEQAAKHFDPTKPVIVFNVGLLMYFSPEQKEKYATNVKNLLQEFGGKWIAPDLCVKESANSQLAENLRKQTGAYYGLTEKERANLLEKVGINAEYLVDEKAVEKLTKVGGHWGKKATKFCTYSSVDINKKLP